MRNMPLTDRSSLPRPPFVPGTPPGLEKDPRYLVNPLPPGFSSERQPETYAMREEPEAQVSDGKLKRWNSRHQQILWMDVAGARTSDIAAQLDFSPQWVSAVKSSELYQRMKQQFVDKLQTETFEDLCRELKKQAIPNVRAMAEVRDNYFEETKDRVAAARVIEGAVDRVYPRVRHIEKNESNVTLSLSATLVSRLEDAMRADAGPAGGAIEADFTKEPDHGAKPLEELIQAAKEEADAEAADLAEWQR